MSCLLYDFENSDWLFKMYIIYRQSQNVPDGNYYKFIYIKKYKYNRSQKKNNSKEIIIEFYFKSFMTTSLK